MGELGTRSMGAQAIIVWTVRGVVPHPEGDDVTAGDDVLAGQVAYYRRRAREYDVTAYGDLDAARARINRIVAALRPEGMCRRSPAERDCGLARWQAWRPR